MTAMCSTDNRNTCGIVIKAITMSDEQTVTMNTKTKTRDEKYMMA